MADDPYVYPGTDILRNRLGIRDADRLSVLEASITTVRLAQLDRTDLRGRYDLDHLRRFHREIFSDVYPWAGEIRTVAIAKTQMFALPQHIKPYLDGQFAQLAREDHLQELSRDRFVERAAHYLGEVNAAHPFREGNGRTQRAFFGQLARDAGYDIEWGRLDPERNIEASVASLDGNDSKLRELLDDLVIIDRERGRGGRY